MGREISTHWILWPHYPREASDCVSKLVVVFIVFTSFGFNAAQIFIDKMDWVYKIPALFPVCLSTLWYFACWFDVAAGYSGSLGWWRKKLRHSMVLTSKLLSFNVLWVHKLWFNFFLELLLLTVEKFDFNTHLPQVLWSLFKE